MIEKHSKNKVKNQEEENIKKVNLVSEIKKALEKKMYTSSLLELSNSSTLLQNS